MRPEKIKLDAGESAARARTSPAIVNDVVYLGSMTQLMVELRTGEQLRCTA